jgi:hypothetical protein
MGLQGIQYHLIEPAPAALSTASPRTSRPVEAQREPRLRRDKPRYPAIADRSGGEFQVYFGDIHAHSVHSDGTGDADEFYLRAMAGFQDDLASLTDHDYLDGIELSASTFKWMGNLAARFNLPGRFVTFTGYEWTAPAVAVHAGEGQRVGEGHKHILFPGDDGPLFSYGDPRSDSGAKLMERLKDFRCIAIPHHIAWSNCHWDYHDPEIQRLVEICSAHGRYEHLGNRPIGYRMDQVYPNNFIQDVLNTGIRLGFTGGTDNHGLLWHGTYPAKLYGDSIEPGSKVSWRCNTLRTGLTAILAPELTREALYEALYQRRCYATSGEKIFLDFRVNGMLMGSDFTSALRPVLSVHVIGTSALRVVEIIRDGQVMSSCQWGGSETVREVSFNLIDASSSPNCQDYYYLRVLQEGGDMAWSSPIWVRYQPE